MVGSNGLSGSPRVVIVDELDECGEVLETLLTSRGVPSITTRGVQEGIELVRQHQPSVVILDLAARSGDDPSVEHTFDRDTDGLHSRLIVLGHAPDYLSPLPASQVLAKPYHYAPLVRTIEQLLGR